MKQCICPRCTIILAVIRRIASTAATMADRHAAEKGTADEVLDAVAESVNSILSEILFELEQLN